jgi:putative ABC transport system permease protein
MIKWLTLLWESIRMALDSLWTNKLRSLLSVTGITIGIFTIIAVYTASDSLERNIRESVESMGDNVIVVQKWPWAFGNDYAWWDYMKRPDGDFKEYQYLKKYMDADDWEFMAFSVKKNGSKVRHDQREAENVTAVGVTPDFFILMGEELEDGHLLTDFECDKGKNAAVLGFDLYQELFEGRDGIGDYFKLDGRKMYVAGVLKQKGSGLGPPSLDNAVLVPYHYLKTLINTNNIGRYDPQILIKGKEEVDMAAMEGEVRRVMRNVRKLGPDQDDNFALNKMTMITQQLDSTFAVINVVVSIIGMFSLLVGGFGIANIMFVSVKERTNIIGIQKALGAKRSFIMFQFLSEAIALCIIGGLIGMGLVALIAMAINNQSDFSIYMSATNFAQGLGISSIIGLLAGFIPAWRGSRLEPVVAIRSK